MGAKKPKVKTYDPSKYEAKIQVMKQDLAQSINDKAVQTQKGALDESEKGINDLYAGIGLLSNYMRSRTDSTKVMGNIYKEANSSLGLLSHGMKQQASKIVDNIVQNYRV